MRIVPVVAVAVAILLAAACTSPWAPDPAQPAATPPVLQSPWSKPGPQSSSSTWPPYTLEVALTTTGDTPISPLGVRPDGRYRLDFRGHDDWTIAPIDGTAGPTITPGSPPLVCQPDCVPGPPSVQGVTQPFQPFEPPFTGAFLSVVSRVPGIWTYEAPIPRLDATLAISYLVEYGIPLRWRILRTDGTVAMEYRATKLELADGTSLLPANVP